MSEFKATGEYRSNSVEVDDADYEDEGTLLISPEGNFITGLYNDSPEDSNFFRSGAPIIAELNKLYEEAWKYRELSK